jgi:hypothetical protein
LIAKPGLTKWKSRSSVGAGFVAGLFEVARQRTGVERAVACCAQAGFGRTAMMRPTQARLADGRRDRVVRGGRRAERARRSSGWRLPAGCVPGTFSVLGYALMTCRTLGEAIEVAPHFRRLVFDIGYSEMRFRPSTRKKRGWAGTWYLTHCPIAAVWPKSLIASWYPLRTLDGRRGAAVERGALPA